MTFKELLKEKNKTMYRVAVESGISKTTIVELGNHQAKIENCRAATLQQIARALDMTMEELLETVREDKKTP